MLCAVSSVRMNHFGIKPVVGGSPPRENRRMGVEISRALFLAQEMAKELIVLPWVIESTLNIQ